MLDSLSIRNQILMPQIGILHKGFEQDRIVLSENSLEELVKGGQLIVLDNVHHPRKGVVHLSFGDGMKARQVDIAERLNVINGVLRLIGIVQVAEVTEIALLVSDSFPVHFFEGKRRSPIIELRGGLGTLEGKKHMIMRFLLVTDLGHVNADKADGMGLAPLHNIKFIKQLLLNNKNQFQKLKRKIDNKLYI